MKVIFVFFVFVFLSISLTYALQIFNVELEDTPKIEFVNQYNHSTSKFDSFKVYDYKDKNSDSNYKVQVIGFDDERELDSWIKNKVEKSSEQREIDGNYLFVDKNNNYLFWRSGNKFIQIISINGEDSGIKSVLETLNSVGGGSFPEQLIKEYISQFPSDCDEEDCFSESYLMNHKITGGLLWFRNPPQNIKSSNYYVDGGGKCPKEQEGLDKLQKNLFLIEEEIEFIAEYCSNNDFYEINGAQIPRELKECGLAIDQYLAEKEISEYDYEITLDECLLRISFLKDQENNFSQEELESIFSKRNNNVFKEVSHSNILRNEQQVTIVNGNERYELKGGRIQQPTQTKIKSPGKQEIIYKTDRLSYLKDGIGEKQTLDDDSPWFL